MSTFVGTDFSTWVQGMLFIICVYHLSAYFFTKDKDFLLYAIFVFLMGVFSINLVKNTISVFIYRNFKSFFDTTFWVLQVWFWLVAGRFYLGFLNLKEVAPEVGLFVKKYLITTLIVSTSVFLIDYLFFNQKYFVFFDAFVFVPISFALVVWVNLKMNKIKSSTIRFFEFANLILIISQTQLMFSLLYPNLKINLGINTYTFFLVGVFINIIIISVGLGYKYQLVKQERDELNLQLIDELKKNEALKDKLSEELSRSIEKANSDLEKVAREAKKLRISQIKNRYRNELDQLKFSNLLSHMNPHFLFNSLNSIKVFIIENKQREAAFYLNKFSKFMRRILDASSEKSSSLLEELDTIKLYTIIENIRFDDEILFKFDIDKTIDTEKIKLPPLVLHPFIENAIWHGVSSLKKKKIIRITIKKEEKFIVFIIKDNGIGRKASEIIETKKRIKRTSFGINAAKERLDNFYKTSTYKYSLDFIDLKDNLGKGKGTIVKLKLPLTL